jgi:integrase
VISYTSNLHTAADAAVRAGIAIAGITSIAVLVRPEVYLAILKRLLADAEQKATANLHNVATMVPILAQGWLRQSPEEIAALKALKAKLPKMRPDLTQKNRDLLASFDNKALLQRLLRLGDDLWKEALSDKRPRNQRLVRAQMALLIGILQITPLRRKNMCALVFDRHITWPNGPNAEALIQVPSQEGKTELDYLGELPLDLSRRLHHYRTKLVQALTRTKPTHLFVKSDGKPKRQENVTNRLEVTLKKRLGIEMSMHQFRHLCGKLMLDDNPGAYEAVAQLLGHRGPRNVVRFYAGVDTRRAVRHHTKLIERLREEAKTRSNRRRKK